jgi:hypothetical protein
MFSVIVAKVTENPQPGSDEIDKAFDEGWIGTKGYRKSNGEWQNRAIAFSRPNNPTQMEQKKTEVFVLDLPEDLATSEPGKPLAGTTTSRPNVPAGIAQRRITYTSDGVQGPRHCLRCTPDGNLIAFLSKDHKGIYPSCLAYRRRVEKFSNLLLIHYSIQGPFNFSSDGSMLHMLPIIVFL